MAPQTNPLIAITGAASGIGRATASLLAQRGARLSLADINTPALDEVAKELAGRGAEVRSWTVDVREQEQVEKWINDTVREFGGLLDGE
jgi:NADP-dependent 3-hydroxy acid dehydrogenase YdfG